MRKLYGYRYAHGSGQKQTIEEIDLNDIAVITYKWVTPDLIDANEAEKKLAKEWTRDTWGFNGYVVKDDIAFDIHLSADMSKLTKNQMLDIIKSFQIKPSTESEESSSLFKIIEANPKSQQNEKLLKDFIGKYPTNPEAYCYLAECYKQSKQLQDNKTAYLKAMENHKIQPLTDPILLFKCYYSLGMYYDITKEYAKSEQYHKLGYNLAKKSRIPTPYTASSAYNLARLYAQTNQPDKSVDFLIEAIRLNPRYKDEVKENPSLDKIKDNPRLKNLLGK
jgi:tetratricopeptide (TPR) repeat protein